MKDLSASGSRRQAQLRARVGVRGRSLAWAAMAVLPFMTGCATVLGGARADETQWLRMEFVEDTSGVVRIKPVPAPVAAVEQARNPARRFGWMLDVAAGAGLTQAVPWATRTDATLAALAGGLLVTGTDYWLQIMQPAKGLDRLALSVLLAPVGIPFWAVAAPVASILPEAVRVALLHEAPASDGLKASLLEVWSSSGPAKAPLATFSPSRGLKSGTFAADLEPFVGQSLRLVLKSEDGLTLASAPYEPRAQSALRPAASGVAEGLPSLEIREVSLETPRGKNLIHAEKGGTLVIRVANTGKGPARGVKATLVQTPRIAGLDLAEVKEVGTVPAGGAPVEVRVPISADVRVPDATSSLEVRVEDARRVDARPVRTTLTTKALELPDFRLSQNVAQTEEAGELRTGRQFDAVVEILNAGGWAEDVQVRLKAGNPDIMFAEESDWLTVGKSGLLRKNESAVASWSLIVRNAYDGPAVLPLSVEIRERHPKAARTFPLDRIALNQKGERFHQIALDPVLDEEGTGGGAALTVVDVDQPLETKVEPDPQAVALVVGIQKYNPLIPPVPFAFGDAAKVRTYMTDALGVPPQRVFMLRDDEASKTRIQTALKDKLGRLAGSKSNVYVYFAGHGAPDPVTGEPYLVPYDGDPQYIQSSFLSLAELYASLGKLGARSATVMLDSCFSGGASRTEGEKAVSLIAGRPVAIQEKRGSLPAGVTVLTATSVNQISSAWRQMKHGLFTYFLLKGLRGGAREAGGGITVRSLADYVGREVSGKAAELLLPSQEPQVQGEGADRVLVRP